MTTRRVPFLRSAFRYRGAILCALLQAAPVTVERENGRFAFGFGFGGDHYEQAHFACDGSAIEERAIDSRTVSGAVNIPLRTGWSLEGFGGNTSTASPVCAESSCSLPPAFKGGFGGLRVRTEVDGAAFAAGIAALPGVEIDYVNSTHRVQTEWTPTLLMRLGSDAPGRKHFLADINNVRIPGSMPLMIFGMGFSSSEADPVRGFVGFVQPPYSGADNGTLAGRVEMMIPLGARARLNLGASMNTTVFAGNAGLVLGSRARRPSS